MSAALDRSQLPDWPRLMAVDLAAAYVGLSPSSVRVHGPPARKFGKRVLYDRRDLDNWADRLSDQPLDEKQKRAEGNAVQHRVMERLRNGS